MPQSRNTILVLKASCLCLTVAVAGYLLLRSQSRFASVPASIGAAWAPAQAQEPQRRAESAPQVNPHAITGVARVVDAHTLMVGGKAIMLNGIRVPAEGAVCMGARGPWDCYSPARDALRNMVGRDEAAVCMPFATRTNGTIIASCRVGATDLAGKMLTLGWAMYDNGPLSHIDTMDYAIAEAGARQRRNGIWFGTIAEDQVAPRPDAH